MTGMKEGAGEDPFADDDTPDQPSSDSSSTSELEPSPESAPASDRAERATGADESTRPDRRPAMDIPYKFRRDGVQDGRSRVPLFVQPETKAEEQDALRRMEDRFAEDDVSLTDLREALVLVGLAHLDEVEARMEEWGYGVTFE